MADPVTLIAGAGAAVKGISTLRQGGAAYQQGKASREAAYAEAEYRDQQAEQEVAVASVENRNIARRMREILSANQAAAAAGGGSSTDGTVVAVANENAKTSVLDQLRAMTAAEERAQQIEYGADLSRRDGDIAFQEGKEARRASYVSAGTTLLQAGANWQQKFGGGSSAPGGKSVDQKY